MTGPEELLRQAVSAARSKVNHQERMRAAEEQRDQAWAELHDSGWTYGQIEARLRAALGEQEAVQAGVSVHNIRARIRAVRAG